jgi:hypothetical protein
MLYEFKNKAREGNMSSRKMVDKIYVSIASYMDDEISSTLISLMNNTSDLDNIFVYVLVQDKEFPKLDSIFELYNFKNYFYQKQNYLDSNGVGAARAACQSKLSEEYTYFFQVDSHTQFIRDWDIKIVKDYEAVQDYWGMSIISTYPNGYEYDSLGMIKFTNSENPPVVKIIMDDASASKFEAKYTNYIGGKHGDFTGYFCAGQAFGYSKYFLSVPYDDQIAFHGEEQTMSVRFFLNGIQIICPPQGYVYHDYVGTRRKRGWDTNPRWSEIASKSNIRVQNFFSGAISDGFGASKKDIDNWFSCFIF